MVYYLEIHAQGFTLLEVMIVVVIIGILASMAIPTYKNFVMNSKVERAKQNLERLADAASMYFLETGADRAHIQNDLVGKGYINKFEPIDSEGYWSTIFRGQPFRVSSSGNFPTSIINPRDPSHLVVTPY